MSHSEDNPTLAEQATGRARPTRSTSPDLARVTHHRIYADASGESHFDTVTIEQKLASGAAPAAPFYVSEDRPASRYRFYSFAPGWIGELHPAPTRQLLACMSGMVEMQTTDGTIRRLKAGDVVLLEDIARKGHITRNIGDGWATFLAVPVPAVQ